MSFIFAIVGALFGAMFFGITGLFFGGIVGYLFGGHLAVYQKISALDEQIKEMRHSITQLMRQAETKPAKSEAVPQPGLQPVRITQPQPLEAPSLAAQAAASSASDTREIPTLTNLQEAIVQPAAMQPAGMQAPAATPSPVQTAIRPPLQSKTPALPPAEFPPIKWLRDYFTGGNLLVRVGIIILFFGVAFLFKYAVDHDKVPIELRLIGVAIGAIVMLVIGWRLREKRAGYALAMQGGAIGILYLTVFASFKLYQLIPSGAAFALLALMGVFSAILAIKQNAMALAVMGISGGFLAPILTSTNSGNHVALFSYYALLNAGILGIALYKSWRPLNLLGFIFTFVIATLWGVNKYQPELLASTEPFLILFFLFYVAIAVLYATRQPPNLKGYVDGTLVFGTPIIAFALQAALMRHTEYGLAFSALALGAFYLVLAGILYSRHKDSLRLLVEAFLAMGVVFATLAVPLAFDGRVTAATWAVEGAAVLWASLRQQRLLGRLFGALLILLSGLMFFRESQQVVGLMPVLNSDYLGAVLISLAALFGSWQYYKHHEKISTNEAVVGLLLFLWGVLWWFGGGLNEIAKHYHSESNYISIYIGLFLLYLLFVAISCGLFSLISKKLNWPRLRMPALLLLPFMFIFALAQMFTAAHPFISFGFVAWAIAFIIWYWVLKRQEAAQDAPAETGERISHLFSLLLLGVLLSWEAGWQINRLVEGGGSWPLIAWAVVPCILLLLLTRFTSRIQWPLNQHAQTYLGIGGAVLAVCLWLWSLFSNFTSTGDPSPLPYVPLLNPLDVAQALVLITLIIWALKMKQSAFPAFAGFAKQAVYVPLAIVLFVWLNAILLRTLHYWAGVPFNFDQMMHSTLVQTSFSIFWTVIALATMLLATRKKLRPLWIVGAALMGIVVLKLFTLDLSHVEGIQRIVSFIVVGVLMLVIGYFSPLPPAAKLQEQKA